MRVKYAREAYKLQDKDIFMLTMSTLEVSELEQAVEDRAESANFAEQRTQSERLMS